MNASDWDRKFDVFSISRNYLHSIGMKHAQVATLTDEDMTRIAEIVVAHHVDSELDEEVLCTARFVLADKRNRFVFAENDKKGVNNGNTESL